MQLNPIKEQRKLAQKYIIGYFSSDNNFPISLLESLNKDNSTSIELLDLSKLNLDELNLYITTLDEILIYDDSNLDLSILLSSLKSQVSSNFFVRLCGKNSNIKFEELLHNIELENLPTTNISDISNSIKSRAKLLTDIKKLEVSSKEKNLKFIMQLVSILEDKDPFTRDHSARVAKYALAIGQEYFPKLYDEKYKETFSKDSKQYKEQKHEFVVRNLNLTMLASWAHDIGKNSIATNLLNKDSKLTHSEYDIIKMHADFGADMIRKILGDEKFAEAIEEHHERIDGNGYHSKTDFSDISKIIAIADSFDAMTTTRPYTTKSEDNKNKLQTKTLKDAINELQVSSHMHLDLETNKMSQQLDTDMTNIFVQILKRDLQLIQEGNLNDVTLISGGLDENGYVKAGYWDAIEKNYKKDNSVSKYEPKFMK